MLIHCTLTYWVMVVRQIHIILHTVYLCNQPVPIMISLTILLSKDSGMWFTQKAEVHTWTNSITTTPLKQKTKIGLTH